MQNSYFNLLLKPVSLALIFLIASVYGASLVYLDTQPLIQKQTVINNSLIRWKSIYDSLKPYQDNFNQSFIKLPDVKDSLDLIKLFDFSSYGLDVSMDGMRVASVDKVTKGDVDLGLVNVCYINNGQADLTVKSSTLGGLVSGIERLSQRKDVLFGQVDISVTDKESKAKLGKFCLLARAI